MPTILLADDDAKLRALVRATLGSSYRLVEAADGLEAVQLARADWPDLALLDGNMPEMNGFEVCRQLKNDEQDRRIAVIMLTGLAAEEDRQRGMAVGADTYLTKPFSPSELLSAVEEALADTGAWPSADSVASGVDQAPEVPPELAQTLAYARELRILYSERKQAAEALERQHLYDALTGLPNRTHLLSRLDEVLESARATQRPLALILLDVDRFKDINDTFGHHSGDVLLKEIGPRLRSALRETDVIARLGGDEFAVLLTTGDSLAASLVARRMLRALEQPFKIEGLELEVGASLGIALYPEHGTDSETLMRRADVAMYAAKRSHGGSCIYDSQLDPNSPSKLVLPSELRRTIERNELMLHYQPLVDFETGRVDRVEALVRWKHPERGVVPPDEFIPLAEEIGFIDALTRWVMDAALRQSHAWRAVGVDVGVAVNLSVNNLKDAVFPEMVLRLLETRGMDPRQLNVEITESTVMADPSRAREALTRLRNMGIRIAIDDFGTGYSSLAWLSRLPLDEIKIDKSFVMNIEADAVNAVIVRSTINLGHSLGLQVVAEGIENRTVWETLANLGCDLAQGYYLSRPAPADEFEHWLRNRQCTLTNPTQL